MKISTLIVLLAGLTASCASYKISTERDSRADFSKYKSFAWLPPTDTIKNSSIDRKLLIRNIYSGTNDQLKKLGFAIDPQNPDLLIRCYTMVQNKSGYRYNNPINRSLIFKFNSKQYPGMYKNVSPDYTANSKKSVEYQEGALIIEVIDLQTRNIVWTGQSNNALIKTRKLNERVQIAITKIFQRFPVKTKKK